MQIPFNGVCAKICANCKISLQKLYNLVAFVIGFPKCHEMLKCNDWNYIFSLVWVK